MSGVYLLVGSGGWVSIDIYQEILLLVVMVSPQEFRLRSY